MKERLVVIGAGGHARSVMDVLIQNGDYDIIGCLSPNGEKDVLGIPVLGDDQLLPQLYQEGCRHVFVALGKNKLRCRISERCREMGFRTISVISRNAVISSRVEIGEGACVLHGAVIHVNSRIGRDCIINTAAAIDHDCVVGEGCHIAGNSYLAGTVSVGDYTLIAPGAVIRDGISIGKNCVIGMGAVATKNIPDEVMAYGVPACIVAEIRE